MCGCINAAISFRAAIKKSSMLRLIYKKIKIGRLIYVNLKKFFVVMLVVTFVLTSVIGVVTDLVHLLQNFLMLSLHGMSLEHLKKTGI